MVKWNLTIAIQTIQQTQNNMKKLFGVGVLSIAAMGMLIGAFAGQKHIYKEAQGYSTSTLPTTIDLNDTSAANIRSYYSTLNNLSTSERQGTNLLKNLKTILKNGQKYYSYDSGDAIWQIYEITDRDWSKSPASSTTYGTYNSSTNKITNYTYGSNSNSKNNPYIHALYINRNVTNQTRAWGNHNQDEWGINREHVWPKAEGFETSGAGGARGDPMHLMAGNGYSNNIHSNYYYGYVKTSSTYTDCGDKYSNQTGNLRGTSKTLNTGTVFEPQDCDKGDIARAIFYMVARYNYLSGSDSDGINSNNPNLTLTQDMSDWSSTGYTSSTSTQGKMGILTDLLAWHHADPVDEYEIHRNNLLYTNYTNNRNPFIDFPEWVDYIWGTATYNGSTYQSYNSTPTGYATPSSDTINGYNGASGNPAVNSVTVTPSTLTLYLDGTKTGNLTANVSVSNGASQSVSWTSSNTSVATVSSSGVVTAKAAGSTTITARSTFDNTKYGTCEVTVSETGQGGSSTDYSLYSGTITEGNYVIYYDGKAMKNTVSSNRLSYEQVTPTNNVISEPANSIIWHIAPNGNYWTIYNSAVQKYAAGNGTKNQAALDSSIADSSRWTVTGTSTYEFVNKGNTSSSVNANLRNNDTYGFACYSTGTGGELSLYKQNENAPAPTPTSLTATVSKDFYVGDTITKSDITLKDNLNNTITDFEFSDYQFTYEDAPSGGGSENYYFNIPHDNLSATLVIPVSRKNYSAPSTSQESLSAADGNFSSVTATSYSQSDDFLITKGTITYSTTDSYLYSSKYLSFRTYSGDSAYYTNSVFSNVTKFDKTIINVEITLYGSNKPTIDYTLEYSDNPTDEKSWSTTNNGNCHYFRMRYIGEFSGFVNISTVVVTLAGEETANNVANYIMYEDNEGQCNDKFGFASGYFANMSKAQKTTFMTSDDLVIATARERFEAWATNKGKTINYSGGDYVISSNNVSPILKESNQSTTIVVVSISAISLLAIGMFLLKYKKKED